MVPYNVVLTECGEGSPPLHLEWLSDVDPDTWHLRVFNDGPLFEDYPDLAGDSRAWDFVATWENCAGGNEVWCTIAPVVGGQEGPEVMSNIRLGDLSV